MKIIIAGGGESGEEIAKALISEKHEVIIIESDKKRAEELADKLDCLVINDNATDPRVLEEAGIKEADVLIAMTGNDRDNILVAIIAKQFGLDNIIVRIDNPVYNDILLYIGIPKIVNPGRLVAIQILSMLKGIDLLNISAVFRGNIRFYLLRINKELDGKKLGELPIDKKHAYPLLIYRGEDALFPEDDLILQEGDSILLALKPEASEKILKELGNE